MKTVFSAGVRKGVSLKECRTTRSWPSDLKVFIKELFDVNMWTKKIKAAAPVISEVRTIIREAEEEWALAECAQPQGFCFTIW